MHICFASNNKNKHYEIQALIGTTISIQTLEEIGCSEELQETQNTLEGNALQKAEYVFKKFNIACFADDTGLEVEALHGKPGVYSARYAGSQRSSEDNMSFLLDNLADSLNRKAQFRTVITYIDHQGTYSFEGIISGTITETPKGSKGFGYDPIFIPEGSNKSFGEMDLQEKNQFSHRAKATAQLVEFLKERFK